MDVNKLLQVLGLNPVSTPGQALGVTPNTPFTPPRNDVNLLQLIQRYMSQGAKPLTNAAQDVYGATERAVRAAKPMPLPGYLPSAFNALNIAPLPTDLINNLMQIQNPQG